MLNKSYDGIIFDLDGTMWGHKKTNMRGVEYNTFSS